MNLIPFGPLSSLFIRLECTLSYDESTISIESCRHPCDHSRRHLTFFWKRKGEPNFFREYDIYHDESQIAGYWHGILFVPRDSRQRLLNLLAGIRSNTDRHHPISLKNLEKASGKLHRCVSCWTQIGVAALLQDFKGRAYSISTGKEGQWGQYCQFTELVGARFILFRIRGGLGSLNLCPDYAARVETTFRMAFKGGLTMFSRQGDELCIRSLHFDGHKHYKRRLDLSRILRNMGNPPQGVRIHSGVVLDDDSSDHRQQNCQPYDDCQLLQLTDLLVSGFRTVLAESTSDAQRLACAPLAELASKWDRGPKGFKNSRWFKGFCISEGFIENGEWQFGPIKPDLETRQP